MDRAATATAQWRQEIPGHDYGPMEVLGRLAEVAQVINQTHLTPVFARFGLQPGEFDVLATLRRSGAPYRLSPTQLFKATMMSSGGMTARLDRLETAGLVMRSPCPKDRRSTQVGLTAKGTALVEQALLAHLENETRLTAALTKAEQQQLGQLLARLLAGLPEA
ncbi:MAG: MarR family transcriptional regulator [Paracoccaceae bacterium]